ncbi:MAG: carboxypeptidase regulatory-like domain-containing protein [Acidobacteriota bacterium]
MPKGTQFLSWVGAVLFLGGPGLFAQATLSTVRGTVTDRSGGILPGSEVTLVDKATNVVARTLLSAEDGSFEIPDVKSGTYRLTVTRAAFKTFVADDIRLDAGQIRRIEVRLDIGEVTEQVTVTAGAAVITTDTATLADAIADVRIKDSPLNNSYPKPWTFMILLPGVQAQGGNAQVAGQPNTQVSHGFDGVENDRQGNQMNNVYFFEELTVGSVNAKADQSRVANYQLTSKRGGDQFRGSILYRHFSSGLEARMFFDPRRTPFLQHEWQVEAAGPILRTKTFFYASWFAQRFPLGSFRIANVPSVPMRQGDFSQITAAIRDPLTGQPFPDKRIPAQRINPVSQKAQDRYIPAPNLGAPGALTNNFGFAHDYPDDLYRGDWPFVRIDHNLSAKNMLYGRFTQRRTPYVLSGGLPGFEWTRTRDHWQTVISDTHMFSPSLVNTFRFGWAHDKIVDGEQVDGRTPPKADEVVRAIGLQGVNRQKLSTMGFPTMSITGFTTLDVTSGGVGADDNTFTFDESLTWVKDRHVWKFGGVLRRFSTFSSKISNSNYGNFTFNGVMTGHAYADFLLGLPRSSVRLDPFPGRTQKAYELGLFLMDTFKVTRRLSLDYGLRWEYFGSPTYEDGLQFNWDRSTGNVVVAPGTLRAVSPLYPQTITVVEGKVVPTPDRRHFHPRLGLAYRMWENFVIRGGYGVFTYRTDYFDRASGGGPFQIAETYFNAITGGQPMFAFPNAFPTDLATASIPSQSVRGYPLQTRDGSIHQFNISLERQIGDIGVRLSYVGSRSRSLNYDLGANKPRPSLIPFTAARRPYPQFVGTTEVREDGQSKYESLQFQVQRKVGAITFNGHWTWAANMHNWLNTENPYDVTRHWSRDSLTRRHRAVIDAMIDLPWGRGRRYLSGAHPAVDAIIGGWNLQTISIFSTALYFSPSFSGSDPSNTNTVGGLPDRIADGNVPAGQRSVDRSFDASAFRVPEPGRFGNSGVNVIEGQGVNLHHLTLSKRFQITERFRLVYTGAISNLFNTPHFLGMRTNISVAGTGQLTSLGGRLAPERSSHRHANVQLRLEF